MLETSEPIQRRMCELYGAGKTLRGVIAETGGSVASARNALLRRGLERRARGPKRKPMFDIVIMRAHGMRLLDIAGVIGVGSSAAVCLRLQRIEADASIARLTALSPPQLAAYRTALDEDRLTHPDALEIALEYEDAQP